MSEEELVWPRPIPVVERLPEGEGIVKIGPILAYGSLQDDKKPNDRWHLAACVRSPSGGSSWFVDNDGDGGDQILCTHWLPVPPRLPPHPQS